MVAEQVFEGWKRGASFQLVGVDETLPIEQVYPAGPIKRIHVNQARIRKGLPAIIVRTSKGNPGGRCWNDVTINGPSDVVQSTTPLSCGARVWVETHAEVVATLEP